MCRTRQRLRFELRPLRVPFGGVCPVCAALVGRSSVRLLLGLRRIA